MGGVSKVFFLAVLWFSSPPESIDEGYFKEGWAPVPTESHEDCLKKRANVLAFLDVNRELWENEGVNVSCYYLDEELTRQMFEQYFADTETEPKPTGTAL